MSGHNGHAPLVSVIIPAFNAGEFVREAIESVLAQTFRDFEIVTVDDGSTDQTPRILQSYGSSIRRLSQKNRGPASARNHGILASTGRYIAFLDADDLWIPTKLEKQIEAIERNPNWVAVHTDSTDIDSGVASSESRLKRLGTGGDGAVFGELLTENFVHTSSVLVRRTALADSGLFDSSLFGSEDIDLWLRLALLGEFGCIHEVLAYYRRHPGNTHRTIGFSNAMIRARRIMHARWGDDPRIAAKLRASVAHDYWTLGFKHWHQGAYRSARRSYWKSGLYGNRTVASWLRAAICCLPSPVVRGLIAARTSAQQMFQQRPSSDGQDKPGLASAQSQHPVHSQADLSTRQAQSAG